MTDSSIDKLQNLYEGSYRGSKVVEYENRTTTATRFG